MKTGSQARQAEPATNRRHQAITLSDLQRHVLVLCDGTRSRDEILAALVDGAARGDFVLHQDAQPLSDPTALRELLGSRLPHVLKDLARLAFLTVE